MSVECKCNRCKKYRAEIRLLRRAVESINSLYKKKCLGEPVKLKQIYKTKHLVEQALKVR